MRPLAAVAAIAASTLVLAGCGGGSRVDGVDAYFRDANAVQTELAGRLGTVNQAYAGFSNGKTTAAQRRAIAQAPTLFAEMRRRLAAIDAPADAEPIHRDLLRLAEQARSLAVEMQATTVYLPAFRRAVAPVTSATAKLVAALRTAQSPPEQAEAFRGYGGALARSVAALRKLDPPPALAPSRELQLSRFARTRAVVVRMTRALDARDRQALPQLVEQLRSAAEQGNVRAQATAIRAYNSRVHAISKLTARIGRERLALQRRLG
jgi:hypothetical protein